MPSFARADKNLIRLAVVEILLMVAPWAASESMAAKQNPNVLLVIVDDLGFADLGCLGSSDMRTPAIDQLFADSLRLNRLYANCPVCSPTRASVITGCYPDRVGVPGVIRTRAENSWGYFAPRSPTLPERMQELGYATAAVGKWHLGLRDENHPQARGFDQFHGFLGDMMDDYFDHRREGINYMRLGNDEIDPPGHATDLFAQWASDYISDPTRATSPWFLYLAFNAPHTPIQPPDDWLRKVTERESGIDPKRAKLVALIEHMDAGIGQVLQSLRDSGQWDNTIVVFTSDNGGQTSVAANNGPLRDGKGSMYEGGLRIPGCIRVPGITKPGTSTDAVCVTMDVLPTLVELIAPEQLNVGTTENKIDGLSWFPLLAASDSPWPARDIYFVRREGGTVYAGLTIEAVLRGNLKLVHNFPTQEFELFDLEFDPAESNDLSKKQPKRFREMIELLQLNVQNAGQVPWQKIEP